MISKSYNDLTSLEKAELLTSAFVQKLMSKYSVTLKGAIRLMWAHSPDVIIGKNIAIRDTCAVEGIFKTYLCHYIEEMENATITEGVDFKE